MLYGYEPFLKSLALIQRSITKPLTKNKRWLYHLLLFTEPISFAQYTFHEYHLMSRSVGEEKGYWP